MKCWISLVLLLWMFLGLNAENISYERAIDVENELLQARGRNREKRSDDTSASAWIKCPTKEEKEFARKILREYRIVGKYVSYELTRVWLKAVSLLYHRQVKIIEIGNSTEGRPIEVVKLGIGTKTKPAIFLEFLIHAQEWASGTTAIYMINEFMVNFRTNPEYKALLKHYDWYFLPIANPDGFVYTQTKINGSLPSDRFWRKSRSKNPGSTCVGTDLNRNFGFSWAKCVPPGNDGCASSNPCDEIYAGSAAFSEPETRAIKEFVLERKEQIKMYASIHTFGQLWLVPWGFTTQFEPADYPELRRLAKVGVDALTAVNGTQYKIGHAGDLLYNSAGASDDWAKGEAGIAYAYTVELRDQGKFGQQLPVDQLLPTGAETFAAFKAIAEDMKDVWT